ncbi:hypothetical protein MKX01_002036 [Papaver californicum]|nr:hypothetical protein MKX01_002036 [Papaver californicum]
MEFTSIFPGFRFSPTDVELINHYLKNKIDGSEKCDDVISEVDICKFEPWDLPEKSIIKSDHEWFFFSPSGRKYPNGSQAKRATEIGFWKATGKERGIKSGSNVIGTKRTLVFHVGRAPKGERTEWIMHEYCLKRDKATARCVDPYVLCRIRRKLENSENDSQSAVVEDKPMDNSSKKQISDSDSVSFEKPNDTNINKKGHGLESEDDLFADILNDDIINLDEVPAFSSLQGTAQRRIRLVTHKVSNTKTLRARKKNSVAAAIIQEDPKRPIKIPSNSCCIVSTGLILIVLIFFGWFSLLPMLSGYRHIKSYVKY